MDDFELELKQDFLEESVDLLSEAENAFLRLEQDRNNPDLLNEIFRLAHNLKGTSKAVGFDQLSELTHEAENLILKIKEGSVEATDTIVSNLLVFKDRVNEMVEGLRADISASFENADIIEDLRKACSGESDLNVATHPETDALIEGVVVEEEAEAAAPEMSSAALESLLEAGFDPSLLEDLGAAPTAEPKPKPEPAPPPKVEKQAPKKANEDESIRVKLSRIDKINNVIGELVILQTVIGQRRYHYIKDELTNKSIGMMGKLFKEVQELAMSLRMLPLKSTFQKMGRIVRDTSKALDKEVELVLLGEETEVDKTILEKIGDPLVHIIRNAVDHGLEVPAERISQGKDSKGTVELSAFHEGSNLIIQITDNGKGIDPDIIRKKAIEKKLIPEDSLISSEEVIQLIFHPGFSTKEQITEVSGRGVGMDVVKTNIEGLGGEVTLKSNLGKGSIFRIALPLTLAIIEGLVIKSKEEKFVIPLAQIFELTRLDRKDIVSFSGTADLFKLRGEVLPLFYINRKLGSTAGNQDGEVVIVIRDLNTTFGVIIDDVLNQQQIVIKEIGKDIQGRKGIMGSAIMGDGKPAFILDIYELFRDDLKESKNFQKLGHQIGA